MELSNVSPDKGNEGIDNVLENAGKKIDSFGINGFVNKLAGLQQNIKKSFAEGVNSTKSQTKDLINSVKEKNSRLRALETLLKIDNDSVIISNKKNIIYRSESGKLTIIDKDFWGEPSVLTIKNESSVIVKSIRFFNSRPYIFPLYNEKDIKGEICYIEEGEIWYKEYDVVNVLTFKGDKQEIIKVKLEVASKAFYSDIAPFVKMRLGVWRDPRISELIKEKNISIEKIQKIGSNHIIFKNDNKGFIAYYADENNELGLEVELRKLPKLDVQGFEALFSNEICTYCIKNGYALEDFTQSSNYIEYWQDIGSKKVCLMRFKT